jgi:hypothetical protein
VIINSHRFGLTLDADAAAYIAAVESADGASLETAVKVAINAFVVGCKTDGIWSAIKAACIMAGARTLSGALVPLVGPAPTNFNFVSGDYNRETGLIGNGSTKYLNANRLQNASTQNNFHMSVYSSNGISGIAIGSTPTTNSVPADHIAVGAGANDLRFRSRQSSGTETDFGNRTNAGFYGHSRTGGASFTARTGSTNTTITIASSSPGANPTFVYRRPWTGGPVWSSSRLAFYSIGDALDLALLDSRLSTLMTDLANAI